jgi:cyclic beta-1,2-glucan synthetase
LQGKGTKAVELFDLLNPILASSPAGATKYRVEPYVVAADVYSVPPHVGRGGWTWYTGSASWMYRVALEYILGFQLRGDSLVMSPCIPSAWTGFHLRLRRGKTIWTISVVNPDGVEQGVQSVVVDGRAVDDGRIRLLDDGHDHHVEIRLGKTAVGQVSGDNGAVNLEEKQPEDASTEVFLRSLE